MDSIQGGFSLIGLMDGTTIIGFLRVENTPLVQRYNAGTTQYVPDFESMAENVRPVVVPILRNSMDGTVMTPQTCIFKYNGVEITFGEDNLSINEGMEGTFKRIIDYQANIGSQTYTLPSLRVMKNLVPISGYDNDRISVSGTVEVGGQSISFNELNTDVTIQESTGNQYDAVVTNDRGSAFTQPGETLTETVNLYKDGVHVTDLSGYTFQWVKELATGDENMGTARTQSVSTDDVDNVLKIRVDVFKDGSKLVSGFDEVTDFSDPYSVNIKITGITGNAIRNGQTATITPVVVKRSTGEEQAGLVSTWNWAIKDNEGKDFTLTGKEGATFSAASIQVPYADIVRAKMGLSGYVSANL